MQLHLLYLLWRSRDRDVLQLLMLILRCCAVRKLLQAM
jgi:hypothetical protein